MAAKCMSKKAAKITLLVAIIILVISIVVLVLFPTIYNSQLKKEIILTKGSLVTNIFLDIPLPIYERLYFFNISNGDDFLNHGAPLNVTEVGPYTYKSKWSKTMTWNSNGTASYRETRTYHFVQELSSGSEDDAVFTLNGPMIVAINILKTYSVWKRVAMSVFLKFGSESLITQKTIRELAYGGYEDIIIKLAPLIKPDIPYKDGIFSWLYGKNATNDGLFTVFTGEDDGSRTGILDNWNGDTKTNFWSGDSCNTINGTNIEMGPPISENPETYTFFQSIFCRSLTFNYTKDVDHYGIPTRRFQPTSSLFANRTDNPDNHCFDLDDGIPSGVLNISACQFGAPALISFPHFYMADPSYLNKIVGLSPNSNDHESAVDVEPVVGFSVNVAVRFQINLLLSQVSGIFQTYGIPEGIFPVFWADLTLTLTEDWANYFKRQLNNPKIIAYSFLGSLAGVSLILIIVCIVILAIPDDDDVPLIDAKEDRKTYTWSGDYKQNNNHNHTSKNAEYRGQLSVNCENSENSQGGITNIAADLPSDVYHPGTENFDSKNSATTNEAAVLHVNTSTPQS